MQRNKEEQAKQQAARKPGREDVHEQREAGQKREGVVGARPTQQSLADQERADWEGMGQGRYEAPRQPPQHEQKRTQPKKH